MKNHDHELPKDNYEDYCQRKWDFFTTYDYDSIYGQGQFSDKGGGMDRIA